LRGRRRQAGADAPKIVQPKFQIAYSGFGTSGLAPREIAAVQRGWRDFRIAQ
jgi:hypothetical protein